MPKRRGLHMLYCPPPTTRPVPTCWTSSHHHHHHQNTCQKDPLHRQVGGERQGCSLSPMRLSRACLADVASHGAAVGRVHAHAARREAILKAHPEVRALMGALRATLI